MTLAIAHLVPHQPHKLEEHGSQPRRCVIQCVPQPRGKSDCIVTPRHSPL